MFNYIIKGNNYGFNDFYIMKNGSLKSQSNIFFRKMFMAYKLSLLNLFILKKCTNIYLKLRYHYFKQNLCFNKNNK